jgi:precorrin-4 methylase
MQDMTLHVHEHGSVMPHVSPGEGKQLTVSSANIITSVKVCIYQASLRTVNNCDL